MDTTVYNQNFSDLLDDNNTYEEISLQAVLNNINISKSNKSLISNENKSWSSLINYHPINPKIYGLPKIHKSDSSLTDKSDSSLLSLSLDLPPSHNIAKLLAKILSP